MIVLRKNWNNANHNQIDTYKSVLDDNLSVIDIPYECLNCTNVLCSDNDHVTSIQKLHDDIISACIDASENIPTTRKNNKNVPGWNEFISLLKEKHLFGVVFGLTMVHQGTNMWLIL